MIAFILKVYYLFALQAAWASSQRSLFDARAYIAVEPCEEEKARRISSLDVGCVIVISRWPWAYGSPIRTSYWVVLLSGYDTIIVSLC